MTGYITAPIAAPEPPPSNKFKDLWLHPAIIVGVLGTLIILIVAVTILAVRPPETTAAIDDADNSPSTGEDGGADTGSDTSTQDGGADAASQSPEDQETEPTGDQVYFAGKLDLYTDYSIDFDTGNTESTGYEDEPKLFEAAVEENGIGQLNKIQFGEWGDGALPTTAAECDGLEKSDSVHLSRLVLYTTFCYTTTDGRSGYFTVDGIETEDSGSLNYIQLSYTTWKGADDL